ncbi:MAG: hypothetical protein P4L70_04435 [Parasulfuritortus sp.]|jgi:hypothetical protein|nr:hypothetical protein [Parasulfuritortus sp.]
MPANTLKQLINALAFANAGNISEFRTLMEQQETPSDRIKTRPCGRKAVKASAPVVFCVIPKRIPQQ